MIFSPAFLGVFILFIIIISVHISEYFGLSHWIMIWNIFWETLKELNWNNDDDILSTSTRHIFTFLRCTKYPFQRHNKDVKKALNLFLFCRGRRCRNGCRLLFFSHPKNVLKICTQINCTDKDYLFLDWWINQ